eukprot:TRINITY_DN6376_c0_g1_i1.p1 TRINITY_DN6376_c0_g1~~TRINITY_DN6376_c0_g1_i1.p1  ORF type:complete len:480 (+),score=168.87 TRINITY_DN6376_c0_g1_i1:61-1440(+)
MGFEPQILKIIDNIRPDRQTLMFSATFPKQVEAAARKILNKPLELLVGGRSVVCSDIAQVVEVRSEETKFRRLLEVLGEWYEKGSILIFVDRQESVDSLFRELMKAGYPALTLHGGKDQSDRDDTISDFKSKTQTILVATSVAARGLDVKDLNLVVNYEVPNHYEDYVHRVGRTGRAGKKGTAITFICPDEEKYAPEIVKSLKASGAEVPQDLQKMADAFLAKKMAGSVQAHGSGYGGKGYKFDEAEELKKKEERKRQKRAYMGDEDSSSESSEEEEEQPKKPAAPLPAGTAATSGAAAAAAAVAAAGGGAVGAVAAAGAALGLKIIPPGTTPTPQEAKEIAEKFKQLYEGMLPSASKSHFEEELEINDFPQQARWKVTHKGALGDIIEWTGVAVTTRGVFVAPGRNAPPGEKKLYLYIEGSSEEDVKNAKREIKRVLEETAATCQPEKALYSKYSVLQ